MYECFDKQKKTKKSIFFSFFLNYRYRWK